MNQLLFKDIHIFRFAFWAGAASWVIGVIWIWFQNILSPTAWQAMGFVETQLGFITLFLAGIVAAITGACCFANERYDRSADFLAMLPVSRKTIIYSKLLIAIPYVLLLATISIYLIWDGSTRAQLYSPYSVSFLSNLPILVVFASFCILNLGVGFLLSSHLSNAAYAAIGTILFWGILSMVLGYILARAKLDDHASEAIYSYVPIAIGFASLLAGWQIYERRVAP